MDEQSRLWPVFIEMRDSMRAILAPPLPLSNLIRRGRHLVHSLRQTPRRRKMQRSKPPRIFRKLLG